MLLTKNSVIFKRLAICILLLTLVIFTIGYVFTSGDIAMILQSTGHKVPSWVANSLTTIGGVYGVRDFILGALGFTVPLWAAAAIAATGAAGV